MSARLGGAMICFVPKLTSDTYKTRVCFYIVRHKQPDYRFDEAFSITETYCTHFSVCQNPTDCITTFVNITKCWYFLNLDIAVIYIHTHTHTHTYIMCVCVCTCQTILIYSHSLYCDNVTSPHGCPGYKSLIFSTFSLNKVIAANIMVTGGSMEGVT